MVPYLDQDLLTKNRSVGRKRSGRCSSDRISGQSGYHWGHPGEVLRCFPSMSRINPKPGPPDIPFIYFGLGAILSQ